MQSDRQIFFNSGRANSKRCPNKWLATKFQKYTQQRQAKKICVSPSFCEKKNFFAGCLADFFIWAGQTAKVAQKMVRRSCSKKYIQLRHMQKSAHPLVLPDFNPVNLVSLRYFGVEILHGTVIWRRIKLLHKIVTPILLCKNDYFSHTFMPSVTNPFLLSWVI